MESINKNKDVDNLLQTLAEISKSEQEQFKSLIDSITSMETGYKQLLSEVRELKECLQSGSKESIATKLVNNAESNISKIGSKLEELKESVITFSKNSLESLKTKSLFKLNDCIQFLKIKDKLENISKSLENSIADTQKSIEKIEDISNEYHKMTNTSSNIVKLMINRPTSDEIKEIGILAKSLQKPYSSMQNLYKKMLENTNSNINKIENLEKLVASKTNLEVKDVQYLLEDKNEIDNSNKLFLLSNSIEKMSKSELSKTYEKALDIGLKDDLKATDNKLIGEVLEKIEEIQPTFVYYEDMLSQGMEV